MKFIKKIKNQNGAMDSILVTLLLIVMGISAVSVLSNWLFDATIILKNDANTTLQKIIDE